MAARRSRTGCATCRKRKLKCDEARPVCGQCTKSRRECVPSEGVAFRHEQNAGLNTAPSGDSDRSLVNFFKYRNMFSEEQKKNFVPIQMPLEWRHVTDPWADDVDQNPSRSTSSPQAYQQQVASHSLEALSTAATENTPYQPQTSFQPANTYGPFNEALYAGAKGGYGPAGASMQGPNQNNNINFLLNPSSTPAALIDPNLDASALQEIKVALEGSGEDSSGNKLGGSPDKNENLQQDISATDETVANMLKNFDAKDYVSKEFENRPPS